MNKYIFITIVLFLSALFVVPIIGNGVHAGFLKFDTTTAAPNVGQTFQVQVIVDVGSDQATSTDVYVMYDASLVQATNVASGTFFPTVTNNLSTGRVYIAGLVDDPASSKTGNGTLATITFKTLKAGSGTISFDCQNVSNSSKIIKNDINATNIITCSQNGTMAVTVGGGSASTTGSTAPTTAPSELPRSGVFENVMKFALPGIILLLLGSSLRLLL